MARSCAVCGKVSMDGFNPQSSGMNRSAPTGASAKPPADDVEQKWQPVKASSAPAASATLSRGAR